LGGARLVAECGGDGKYLEASAAGTATTSDVELQLTAEHSQRTTEEADGSVGMTAGTSPLDHTHPTSKIRKRLFVVAGGA
jgi:hypothetical protein